MQLITEEKKKLRTILTASRRELLKSGNKEEKDRLIFSKLINDNSYIESKTVLVFVSTDIETDTRRIITDCFDKGKRIATPVSNENTLTFRYIDSFDDLDTGRYGIFEPRSYCDEYVTDNKDDEHTLCIVPGLAFDKNGYRIGYGKGYYDRFLCDFTGITIGLCYKENISDNLPTDTFDVKVDKVITD